MNVPPHELPVHHWECPKCGRESITREVIPQARPHICPALHGLQVPMVPKGSGARIYTREREDYIGAEQVQYDARGRPVMSIITERPDGSNDAVVLAPIATANGAAQPPAAH